MDLYRIVAPHMCCGFVVHGELIIKAAPIIGYMVGWQLKKAIAYCHRREWDVTKVGQGETGKSLLSTTSKDLTKDS